MLKRTIFLMTITLLFAVQTAAPVLADPAVDVLTLVNQERAKTGAPPLTLCANLTTAAQNHTDDMIARQFFDHTNPDGHDPGWRITAAGYHWTTYGENIAVGYSTPQAVVTAWMGSSGHRANILNPNFVHMGLGTALGTYMGYPNLRYWTQTFGAGGSCGGQSIDLAISISDSPDPMSANESLTYVVTAANNGANSAGQSAVTQQLPIGAAFVSATPTQGTCALAGLILSCDLGSIGAGGSTTITIVITPTQAGTMTTSVTVASKTDYDTVTGNNTASTVTTVLPPPPAAPTLIAPLGSVTSQQPTFSWSAPAGAVRYEIQIGSSDPPTTSPIDITTNRYTPPAPMLPGSYFWQVRAFNAAGTPSDTWSSGSFTLDSPANAAPLINIFSGQPVTLTWNRVSWAAIYDLEIADNAALKNPLITASASALFYSTTALSEGTYFWHVRARNGTTAGAWSTPQSFMVMS